MDIVHKRGSELKHKDIFILDGSIRMVIDSSLAIKLDDPAITYYSQGGTYLVLGNLTEPLKSFSEEIRSNLHGFR